ncbi:MAG: WD40/YVTN/BNR-like repeat-containing protein, partial [Blastocatellia bacterium]
QNRKPASDSISKSKKAKARSPKPAKLAKLAKQAKPEGEGLVDLRNQVFTILPLTPVIAAVGNGEVDSQDQSSQLTPPTQPTWMIASTWDGLFLTENEKKGWRRIKFPKVGDGASGSGNDAAPIKINTIVTNPNAPGAIFIGTDEGLFVSQDNGESFKQMTLGEETRRIRSIVFDPRNAETIFVGASNGFFRSMDGGHSWENRGGGMPLLTDVGAVVISAANPNELYLSDESRGVLFHSKDCGTNWEKVDISQLPSLKLWSLVSDPFDSNRIYAGSFSGGVYVMSRK